MADEIWKYADDPEFGKYGSGKRREFLMSKTSKDMTVKYVILVAELLIMIAQLAK